MRTITHKVFVPSSIEAFKLKSYEGIAGEVRQRAQEYINQVGAENVVSITESSWQEGFTITVWHYAP